VPRKVGLPGGEGSSLSLRLRAKVRAGQEKGSEKKHRRTTCKNVLTTPPPPGEKIEYKNPAWKKPTTTKP
jgi:hypothetical protein